ncbi:hypothetical protein DH2020_005050 [Rehmannia glutinosa]|uniref:NB-ARC domain-containing protein n=1 Tax=Rehmannia glutinosa TaxID=99300 RepID=A0ABR0XRS3_REHGL
MVEIVSSISTQMLHDLGREEKAPLIDLSDQVMELVSVLRMIQRLLKNSHNSESVLNHIETIRCLGYRIEDVLETCAVEVAFMFQKNDERCIKKLLRRYFGVLNDGIGLKNISAKISDLEPEIKSFHEVFPDDDGMESIRGEEEPRLADRSVRWSRQMYPRGIEEHFVGMDQDLNQLISLIVEDQHHRVISVLGVKGLGKTTIARKVYNHPQVRRCFKAFAWVSLSQECQIGIVLQDILRQLGPGKVKEITEEQNMIQHLEEVQRQKSCFIVLDSIWEVDQWNHISSAFRIEGVGTKILLTTREGDIADVGFSCKMRLLNEDEGWELLKKHAFPRKNAPDNQNILEIR